MSTNACIGVKDNGVGRYIHNSGEPKYTGVQLIHILKRDGVEKALQVLVNDYTKWSYIDAYDGNDFFLPSKNFEGVQGYGVIQNNVNNGMIEPSQVEYGYLVDDDGTIDVYKYGRLKATIDAFSSNSEIRMRAII